MKNLNSSNVNTFDIDIVMLSNNYPNDLIIWIMIRHLSKYSMSFVVNILI